MARDTSLDEFFGDGEADDTDGEPGEADPDDGGANEVDADAAASDAGTDADDAELAREDGDGRADAVEPAVVTYDVSPDGAECAACGAVVTRRWRDEAGMVCGECKEW